GWSARRVQWPRPFLVSGRPPTATLCPYTTLFRSACTADRMPAPVCPVCVLGKGSLFRYAGIDVFASRLLEVCQYPCACRCHWLGHQLDGRANDLLSVAVHRYPPVIRLAGDYLVQGREDVR